MAGRFLETVSYLSENKYNLANPMYIAEISPAEMRGRFVSIKQLTIVIGILAAQIVNWIDEGLIY